MTTKNDASAGSNDLRKLGELIQDIEIAMFTTVDEQGNFHSRPMATKQTEFNGDLWFFTQDDAPKVSEIKKDQRVNVTFEDARKSKFVAVSGTAELVRDKAKARELWNPALRAWFPKGLDDERLALIRVRAQKAEYWDRPSGVATGILSFVKGATTGQPLKDGGSHKLDLTG